MNIEDVRLYCLAKAEVTEEFPFGEETLVYKVRGKIFAIASLDDSPFQMNLKMNPDLVAEWRERYEDVIPGYHMNKKHWNTVLYGNENIPEKDLKWMIDHSYEQVVGKMKKSTK